MKSPTDSSRNRTIIISTVIIITGLSVGYYTWTLPKYNTYSVYGFQFDYPRGFKDLTSEEGVSPSAGAIILEKEDDASLGVQWSSSFNEELSLEQAVTRHMEIWEGRPEVVSFTRGELTLLDVNGDLVTYQNVIVHTAGRNQFEYQIAVWIHADKGLFAFHMVSLDNEYETFMHCLESFKYN